MKVRVLKRSVTRPPLPPMCGSTLREILNLSAGNVKPVLPEYPNLDLAAANAEVEPVNQAATAAPHSESRGGSEPAPLGRILRLHAVSRSFAASSN